MSTEMPAPLPPEPPPGSSLFGLLKHRLLVIVALVLLFFVGLFLHGRWKGMQATPEGREEVALAPTPGPPGPAPAETKPEEPAAEAQKAPSPAPAPAPGPTPAPAAPPLAPGTPPPAPVTVKGVAFTQALVKIIDDEVNKRFFGWRPNTIVFGKLGLTDNVNHHQLGVLEVARRTIVVLNENLTRFAITEAYNPQVNEAMNFLMVSPDKYWFPSASGKYREAITDLKIYMEDLKRGRSRFYARVDNLIALLGNYKDILGSCYHNLIKDTEADGTPVRWTRTDDYFYFSQGVAVGMSQMLEAVKEDFAAELLKKNTHKLMDDTIHALHGGTHLSPWLITDAAKDGILANHRANLSCYIGEAEHLVATMQSVLATN
ncbi:MAG: DUF2333 family protein [Syntrophobacterales bacterium]|nr:DUF2333 family protein [Syntrophobacterales bacterium]